MSFIWRNAGGEILLSGAVPALVRAWMYRKILSDCGPLPAWITIVGCDPPGCVEYTNTNLSPTGREYLRQTCGEWDGGGSAAYNYAWPDDVPDCPYPDGVTIEAAEDCGALVELCVSVVVTAGSFTEHTGCWYPWYYSLPGYCQGSMGHGSWLIGCWASGGWNYEYISVDCNGNVYYECAILGSPPYSRGYGSAIALDGEDLPIGVSIIPVYHFFWDTAYVGELTITVSKC